MKGAVSWSFEFEDQQWFAGFRDLATHGIDKPVLNVFRMFGMMNGNRIAVNNDGGFNANGIILNGVKGKSDINAIASKNKRSISIIVWNYHDDDVASEASPVELTISGIENNKVLVHHYRIDKQFSNSFETWKTMGSPQNVTAEQYTALGKAGQLQLLRAPEWKQTQNGKAVVKFNLPRQGVSLIQLTW